ncbi:MAG: flagellar biosynthesis protein FlhA [candidate division Zixibacteria bacterium CG_4_9_14_3_um_filter_46_8]|nr:MAG: flagellar biosynthesis protein FlhA [candidate division Zixibacteria bacterium CG_4_9_14_3_um_filter_46_8]
MPPQKKQPILMHIAANSDIALAVAVIAILAVLVIPLPPYLLDLLLTFNIAFSLIILLVTMYITHPLELSVFPGLLLIITLFRLSLNVASTRLILADVYAGEVISAFGNFVVKGNYVVGFVIFLILVIIQFVVITKGAGRIAEVAARFTLDAMPGKQMAIDADLNAGLITDNEARRRRENISREADFYGAMDGASKFVRGDAIAGILITLINIVGGLIIGIVQLGLDASQALQTYTLLTVGDGLVTQIPSLIISTSSGIIVTRAASETNLGQDITKQFSGYPRAIKVAAVVLFLFGIVPGLPTLPFFALGALAGFIGITAEKSRKLESEQIKKTESPQVGQPKIKPEEFLKVDALEVEIGYGLIPLVDSAQGGDILERISLIRRQLATDLGLIVPPIRIRDNIQLEPNQYRIKIKGIPISSFELMRGYLLAIPQPQNERDVEGIDTVEPAFGLKAKWVAAESMEARGFEGVTLVEPPAVLATHLTEVIKNNAFELLSRQDVQNLIDVLKQDYPAVVEEVIPSILSIGIIQKVLQNLLKERIPIKDMLTIVETLADYGPSSKDPEILTEYARHSLARAICHLYKDDKGTIYVTTCEPHLEQLITDNTKSTRHGINVILPSEVTQRVIANMRIAVDTMIANNQNPIILCSPNIRLPLRRMTETALPQAIIISFNEITPEVEVFSVGAIGINDEN